MKTIEEIFNQYNLECNYCENIKNSQITYPLTIREHEYVTEEDTHIFRGTCTKKETECQLTIYVKKTQLIYRISDNTSKYKSTLNEGWTINCNGQKSRHLG